MLLIAQAPDFYIYWIAQAPTALEVGVVQRRYGSFELQCAFARMDGNTWIQWARRCVARWHYDGIVHMLEAAWEAAWEALLLYK